MFGCTAPAGWELGAKPWAAPSERSQSPPKLWKRGETLHLLALVVLPRGESKPAEKHACERNPSQGFAVGLQSQGSNKCGAPRSCFKAVRGCQSKTEEKAAVESAF